MKKKLLIALLLVGILAGIGVAIAAAGGTAQDPLISLSYINDTYSKDILSQADAAVDAAFGGAYDEAMSSLELIWKYATAQDVKGYTYTESFDDLRLKKGDTITGITGTSGLLLAGNVTLSFPEGAVLDVTNGQTVSSGTGLTANVRYLGGEAAKPVFTVQSDTAVLSVQGYYLLSESSNTDYNMLADALYAMGLFKGKDLGYGSGYALEDTPNRIEGLIMFLRLMGEESAALASSERHPFTDVPAWCDPYVGYAYAKGYTNGVSTQLFGTYREIGAQEYVTFLLRALGYDDGAGEFTWDTSLTKAIEFGLLNAGEAAAFESMSFYRAQMVYLSYYGLNGKPKGQTSTLLDALGAKGAINLSEAKKTMEKVTSIRIT